jgi:DNA polymerase IV
MFVSDPALLHIDMDAFFASVEQARHPELRGLPVIVGGQPGTRSVVATASYEARAFGVRTAMPVTQAQQLCPQAVILSADLADYGEVSRRVVDVFRQFTDRVQVVSIDEAFLDVSGCRRLFGPPQTIACRIQEQVYDREGITCSIGIGPSKLLAKLASDLFKPAGIGELTEADVHGRLRELPVRDLFGIGAVTDEKLRALGIATVGLLQDAPMPLLAAAFGDGAGALKQLAYGRSLSSSVRSRRSLPKSVGGEVTFQEDTDDRDALAATLLRLVDQGMTRLRTKGLSARTVTLKVRYSTFHTITRRATLPYASCGTATVYGAAAQLLGQIDLSGRLVRLLGVSLGDLHAKAFQLTLDEGWKDIALDETVDRVRAKYGTRMIRRAGGVHGAAARETSTLRAP